MEGADNMGGLGRVGYSGFCGLVVVMFGWDEDAKGGIGFSKEGEVSVESIGNVNKRSGEAKLPV